ncbi:MAG: hypothetical protein IJH34_00040, partial [Romboutsia sp.]|nr:hypothetical protein [Romboutsia sp.]
MEILRVAVPSGKQCNQITTDDGNKYYFNDEGKINDNLFIVSANPLVVVDEAAKTDLGVIDGAGNVVIPLDKKEIQKIDGVADYLLVVESNPTDSKILDAIGKQNDPGFRPQIANEMSEIEAQILAEMNRDGTNSRILFSDSYSQAGLYDLSGNKIPGTECSFVGQNNSAIYFHDNVKGSASQKMKVASVEEAPETTEAPAEETPVETPAEEAPSAPEEEAPQPEVPAENPDISMNADGSFGEETTAPNVANMFDYNEAATDTPDAMPNDFFEKMQGVNEETTDFNVPSEDLQEEPELEENNIDSYVEPEEPDALISDAIEKFEESYSIVEDLKHVIDKRDEKYDKMVADYERKLAQKDEDHHKEIDELNYKYDTDIAKLKNHGANWQSRYQRANARAEVLDEEGKKKSDTIEKLREQLRESYEELTQLKSDQSELSTKYENALEELKTEQKMHNEEAERADNLQDENN